MLKFLKRQKNQKPEVQTPAPVTDGDDQTSFFKRLTTGLSRTRHQLSEGVANALLGKKEIDGEVLEALETHLLLADVGVQTTQVIIDELTQQVARRALRDSSALLSHLQDLLISRLKPFAIPLVIEQTPAVILMVGVNGAGKTTTSGKLTSQMTASGLKVLLAAGDTFRAAAVEQLQQWGTRNKVSVIAQQAGADTRR